MRIIKGLDYEFVGGNLFYGVYVFKKFSLGFKKGFYLGWDMAFGKGEFEVGKYHFADFDEDLFELLSRLRIHTFECWREMRDLCIDENDVRLKFKFNRGMKKKYG